MRSVAAIGLFLAPCLSLEAQGQPQERLLPFDASVSLTLISTWPVPNEAINSRVGISISSVAAYPSAVACLSWDSSYVSRDTVRISIHGRRRCPGIGLDPESVPTLDLEITAPRIIALSLSRGTGVFEVRSVNRGLPGYEAVVRSGGPVIQPPRYAIAPISWGSLHARCVPGGYPESICLGFIESLPSLASLTVEHPRHYWSGGLLPPFHTPYFRVDSVVFQREILAVYVDQDALDRVVSVAKSFTALYPETLRGMARVQLTTASKRRFICEKGACAEVDLGSEIF